ncbi:MAG: LamG domain-containing protein [Maricaulaceae bacterium]|jgi:hypothetical protein
MEHRRIATATLALTLASCAALDAITEESGAYLGVSERSPTGSGAISDDGLVVAYDFATYTDDGRLRDFGPFGNHGAVMRTESTDGPFGTARVFRDLGDVVDLPEDSSLSLEGPLTVAIWLQLSTPNLHQHIFSCDDMYVLWTTNSNQYRLADTQANGMTTNAETTPIGTWHSVVGVLDATKGDALSPDNIRIYVDGVPLEGTIEPTWAPATLRTDNACQVGAASSGSVAHTQLHFEGVVDELVVFSRALSEAEIAAFSRR